MAERRVGLTPPRGVDVSAGDVWWAAPDPGVGREQSGRRPVVVVSGAEYHALVTALVLAVPVTTRDRGWPNHVGLVGRPGLAQDSWAMTEQCRVLSRARLTTRAGTIAPDCLQTIRRWLRDYLVD